MARRRSRWPWPSRPAKPTISPWLARTGRSAASRPGWSITTGPAVAAPAPARDAASAHRDEVAAGEVVRRTVRDDSAVDHHGHTVAHRQDLVQPMGDENAGDSFRDGPADMGEKLLGRLMAERRGRLVEDDAAHRTVGSGEGAGDLHHLAF